MPIEAPRKKAIKAAVKMLPLEIVVKNTVATVPMSGHNCNDLVRARGKIFAPIIAVTAIPTL